MSSSWRYASASVIGTSHTRSNLPCQDASRCEVVRGGSDDFLVVAVSDGAGSKPCSEVGARLACDTVFEGVKHCVERGEPIQALVPSRLVTTVRKAIEQEASTSNRPIDHYACTLLVAVVGSSESLFFHVGDGSIVVRERESDAYECVFWPQKGEYANQTHFVTDADVLEHVELKRLGRIDEVAAFSDGIESLVLRFSQRAPHGPFFTRRFERLRQEPSGHSERYSKMLEQYLANPEINKQTDDDKTLALATRCRVVVQAAPASGPVAPRSAAGDAAEEEFLLEPVRRVARQPDEGGGYDDLYPPGELEMGEENRRAQRRRGRFPVLLFFLVFATGASTGIVCVNLLGPRAAVNMPQPVPESPHASPPPRAQQQMPSPGAEADSHCLLDWARPFRDGASGHGSASQARPSAAPADSNSRGSGSSESQK